MAREATSSFYNTRYNCFLLSHVTRAASFGRTFHEPSSRSCIPTVIVFLHSRRKLWDFTAPLLDRRGTVQSIKRHCVACFSFLDSSSQFFSFLFSLLSLLSPFSLVVMGWMRLLLAVPTVNHCLAVRCTTLNLRGRLLGLGLVHDGFVLRVFRCSLLLHVQQKKLCRNYFGCEK